MLAGENDKALEDLNRALDEGCFWLQSWSRNPSLTRSGAIPGSRKCSRESISANSKSPSAKGLWSNGKRNGATDSDHAQLCRAEPTVQSLLPILNSMGAFGLHRFWCQPSVNGRAKGDPRDTPLGLEGYNYNLPFCYPRRMADSSRKGMLFSSGDSPTLSAILSGDGLDEEQGESL